MSMRVCVCLCIDVYFVCVCIYIYICVCVCVCVCVYVYMCMYICMCICVCIYVCMHVYACVYIMCMCVCLCMHMCIDVYECVNMYVYYVCMCTYACVHVYVCFYRDSPVLWLFTSQLTCHCHPVTSQNWYIHFRLRLPLSGSSRPPFTSSAMHRSRSLGYPSFCFSWQQIEVFSPPSWVKSLWEKLREAELTH